MNSDQPTEWSTKRLLDLRPMLTDYKRGLLPRPGVGRRWMGWWLAALLLLADEGPLHKRGNNLI